MATQSRRLPVYLVLDCSESMAGDGIKALESGIASILDTLQRDPSTYATVWISVIAFSRDAVQMGPLTDLRNFQMPKLEIHPGTALGAALRLLKDRLGSEVVQNSPERKGDYRPIVFIVTDGQPTDEWEQAARDLMSGGVCPVANIYAIGCGLDIDTEIMYGISDIVILMDDIAPDAWKRMFIWMSQSIKASRKITGGDVGTQIPGLEKLPSSLRLAPKIGGPRDPRPNQIFLHALCSKTSRPYLMRFTKREGSDRYMAVSSHRLEKLEGDDRKSLPPVDTSKLEGCPPCPYCESQGCVVCECGTVSCFSGKEGNVICLSCNREGNVGTAGGTVKVRQSLG